MHMNCDKFTCKECNLTFVSKDRLKIHMVEHNRVPYKCNECDKIFLNPKGFIRHKSLHKKGGKQYPCTTPGCNEVFQKWMFLYNHMKTQHVSSKY